MCKILHDLPRNNFAPHRKYSIRRTRYLEALQDPQCLEATSIYRKYCIEPTLGRLLGVQQMLLGCYSKVKHLKRLMTTWLFGWKLTLASLAQPRYPLHQLPAMIPPPGLVADSVPFAILIAPDYALF